MFPPVVAVVDWDIPEGDTITEALGCNIVVGIKMFGGLEEVITWFGFIKFSEPVETLTVLRSNKGNGAILILGSGFIDTVGWMITGELICAIFEV